MVLKKSRKINRKSIRQMLTWAHYRFKQHLKHKAFEFGKIVLDVNEAYTSKTNNWTGEIMNVGSREWITVDGIRVNRDINGARGIFLRALVDNPRLKACICY
jgi:putative transposase